MNKVVSLLPYINAKRKNNEQECLRDYIAEFEDLSFEIELEFDKDFYSNENELGFVLRKKAEPYLISDNGLYCTANIENSKLCIEPFSGLYQGFYPSGSIWVRAHFLNGRLNGNFSNFYENFTKQSSINFCSGYKDGTAKYYDETGKLASVTDWMHGQRQGEKTVFFQDGTIDKYFYNGGTFIAKNDQEKY